jgi:hypothetical protein
VNAWATILAYGSLGAGSGAVGVGAGIFAAMAMERRQHPKMFLTAPPGDWDYGPCDKRGKGQFRCDRLAQHGGDHRDSRGPVEVRWP